MNIIPKPKKFVEKATPLSLAGRNITVDPSCDTRIVRAAHTLRRAIEKRSKSFVTVRVSHTPAEGDIFIIAESETGDAYTVSADNTGVTVSGEGMRGAFYGIQTLLQMIKLEDSVEMKEFEIEDAPDFADRGFYHDVTRGRVPKLETLKSLCDTLAYFKINTLQLYIEDAFDFAELDGVMKKDDVLTAEEISELDSYCYDRFVELVPSISTFGHLYNLLQSEKYAHLCEYEDYKPTQHYWIEKMQHHTIDVSNPESIEVIKSLIDQFVGLCRSDKFNICCDETFDLCRGRNAGKDAGEEYFKFVSQIIEHVKSHGKTVMMWGDIVLHHPEKMKLLPEDVIMLNWCYMKEPPEENVKTFAESGLTQYVCPGTSSWNRFIEETDRSYGNISGMAKYGYENGAVGFLNTNWGDYGNICPLVGARYGLVLGAERGWNADGGELGEDFERAFTILVYRANELNPDYGNIVPLLREIESCERSAEWAQFIPWYSANYIEGKKTPLEADEAKCRENIEKCTEIIAKLKEMNRWDVDLQELALAAGGIRLMNRLYLHLAGYDDGKVEYADWLRDYRCAWLRTSKPSQISLIEEFIETVCSL